MRIFHALAKAKFKLYEYLGVTTDYAVFYEVQCQNASLAGSLTVTVDAYLSPLNFVSVRESVQRFVFDAHQDPRLIERGFKPSDVQIRSIFRLGFHIPDPATPTEGKSNG